MHDDACMIAINKPSLNIVQLENCKAFNNMALNAGDTITIWGQSIGNRKSGDSVIPAIYLLKTEWAEHTY